MKSMKPVTVTVYLWEGERFGIKIKSKCEECDISIAIIKNLINKEFKHKPIKLVIKPWFNYAFEAFFKTKGGWHAPIIAVNNRRISQGKVVNLDKLKTVIREELSK